MTLRDTKIGSVYTIISIELDRKIRGRLEALGMTKGTNIRVLNRNRIGSVILIVRGSRLALGKQITEAIEIKGVHW